MQNTLENIIEELKQNKRAFSVTFQKVDGTLSTKNGHFRLPPAKGVGSPAVDSIKAKGGIIAIDNNRARRKGKQGGFFTFYPERVISVKCGQLQFKA